MLTPAPQCAKHTSALRTDQEDVKFTSMKHVYLLLVTFFALLCGGISLAGTEESFHGKVVVIPVGEDSLTSKQSFGFMNRILKRAEDEQARAVVFELNTPGGLAWETSEMMMKSIQPLTIPTYAYVNTKAMSAGALISAACDKIYMAPISSIGAAGIITSNGEEMDPVMRKKAESAFWAFTRSVVTEKGHNPEVIKAMMIPEDEAKQFGPVKLEKGALLTLTGKEATTRLEDGKPLLAEGTATSVTDMLALENVNAPVVMAEPTAFEQIALWIAWASPVLILLGIGGIYLEFKTPGFGIGGIIAIVAFALFFFGNNIAGNLAGYETAALLILGVILLCVEFFLIPGTFIAAIAGSICILLALFGGMIGSWEWEHIIRNGQWDAESLILVLGIPLLKLTLGLGGGAVLIIILMKYLPDSILMRRVMNARTSGGPSGEAVILAHVQIGDMGEAITELKPNGRAIINGEICEVFSRQGILIKGTPVRVVDIRPFDIVVVKNESPSDH